MPPPAKGIKIIGNHHAECPASQQKHQQQKTPAGKTEFPEKQKKEGKKANISAGKSIRPKIPISSQKAENTLFFHPHLF
jgi:hypothetical protein